MERFSFGLFFFYTFLLALFGSVIFFVDDYAVYPFGLCYLGILQLSSFETYAINYNLTSQSTVDGVNEYLTTMKYQGLGLVTNSLNLYDIVEIFIKRKTPYNYNDYNIPLLAQLMKNTAPVSKNITYTTRFVIVNASDNVKINAYYDETESISTDTNWIFGSDVSNFYYVDTLLTFTTCPSESDFV